MTRRARVAQYPDDILRDNYQRIHGPRQDHRNRDEIYGCWNEADVARRNSLLEQCWADGGIYVDPGVELAGRDALAQHIAKMQAGRPGARLEFMSGIDVHHRVLRFLWRLVRADGSCGDTSIDVGEIGPDGRLIKIVEFFGAAPPMRW